MKNGMLVRVMAVVAVSGILVGLAGREARASTKAFFPSAAKAVITVQSPILPLPNGETGIVDPDAEKLFDQMNVPAEGSMIGPGKKIIADNQGFQMVCGLRQGQGYACTIALGESPNLRVSPMGGSAEYLLGGEEGARVRQLFLANEGAEYHYYSGDGRLEIHAVPGGSPAEFRLSYK